MMRKLILLSGFSILLGCGQSRVDVRSGAPIAGTASPKGDSAPSPTDPSAPQGGGGPSTTVTSQSKVTINLKPSDTYGAGNSIAATTSVQNITSPTYAWIAALEGNIVNSGNLPTFYVTPQKPGKLNIQVTVTGSDGASATASVSVQIVPVPFVLILSGTPYSGQVGSPVSFQASATDPSVADTFIFSWSPGDGSKSLTGASVTHSYTNVGTFNVTLTVTDSFGQTQTANAIVTISPSVGPPSPTSLLP